MLAHNAGTLAQPISSSIPPVSNNSSCPTTKSTFQSTNANVSTLPTSDCDNLGKTYVYTIGTHTEFTVHCNSDFGGADFLKVYFFEDHIEAYTSFNYYQKTNNGIKTANALCYWTAFASPLNKNLEDLGGNCLLKDAGDITATHRDYTSFTSAALLNQARLEGVRELHHDMKKIFIFKEDVVPISHAVGFR